MNLTNVNKAIAVMERVKARGDDLDMCVWQQRRRPANGNSRMLKTAEEELHTCGTSACFAGWVAVSPEFKEDGGYAHPLDGAPRIGVADDQYAIAKWLGISGKEAGILCGLHDVPLAYGSKGVTHITVGDVLAALYRLRDTGSALI